jgi:hypothetical protein
VGDGDRSRDGDRDLGAEAIDQLHHADDRRDAAQMRIEELVRDAEFEEDSHREGTRMSPTLIVGLALTGIGVVLALLWLRSLCL